MQRIAARRRFRRTRDARPGNGVSRGASATVASGSACPVVAAEVRHGVDATLEALAASWDAGDARTYGALFTEDATYVAFTGTVYRGREDITRGHAALFAGLLRGSRLSAGRVVGIHVLAARVVSVVARGDTYQGTVAPVEGSKVQTYVMVEQDGQWKVAAFHNTRRRAAMERFQFFVNPASRPMFDG